MSNSKIAKQILKGFQREAYKYSSHSELDKHYLGFIYEDTSFYLLDCMNLIIDALNNKEKLLDLKQTLFNYQEAPFDNTHTVIYFPLIPWEDSFYL